MADEVYHESTCEEEEQSLKEPREPSHFEDHNQDLTLVLGMARDQVGVLARRLPRPLFLRPVAHLRAWNGVRQQATSPYEERLSGLGSQVCGLRIRPTLET